MLITRISPMTGQENTRDLDITQEQLWRWRNGTLIQDAFPNLTWAEREFLKTGFTEEDWEYM